MINNDTAVFLSAVTMRTSHYAHMSRVFEKAIEYSRGCLVSSAKQIRSKQCFFIYRVHFFLLNRLWKGSEIFCEIVGLLSRLKHSRSLIFRIFMRSNTKKWWYFGWLVSVQEAGSLHSSERDSKTFKDAVDLFVSDINLFTPGSYMSMLPG